MSVGIDIGSKFIKIIELQKAGTACELRASGIVGYVGQPPENFKDDSESASFSGLLKKLFKEANISSRDVAISIPEQLVFTRTIKFPLLTDQEIISAIKWEAEQYIPIPLAEAIIQHQVLERKESTIPPEIKVLLVAAPRKLVEKYVKVVQNAGLNVASVETEMIALTRVLAPLDKTVLLVDFGAASTNIAITKNGLLNFSRTIPTAGEAFTRAVAQTLGIDMKQAEEYKRAYGMSASQLEGKIKVALDPVFKLVADEIKKAIQYYLTEEKGESPTSVIVSGGTSSMPEAATSLGRLLGIEIVVGNPFQKIVVNPEVAKTITSYAPLYSIAVGLALGMDQ
ncbi:MAG: type IV pilus assembly protein PilM [Candidatus Microgenomates bacterium]